MIQWESEYGDFHIENNQLFVNLERSTYTVATNESIETLKELSEKYLTMMWKLVDMGYDTVDMIIFPDTNKVKFFQEDFSLGEEVDFDKIKKAKG